MKILRTIKISNNFNSSLKFNDKIYDFDYLSNFQIEEKQDIFEILISNFQNETFSENNKENIS